MSATAERFARAVIVVLTAVLGRGAPTGAQVPPTHRVAVNIDYVSVDGLYLSVGSDQGAVVADTVPLFADSLDTVPRANVLLTSVTRRRSVAEPVSALEPFMAGQAFFVELPTPALATEPAAGASALNRAAGEPTATARARDAARLAGRVSVDLDARETRTSWSGDLFGETVRRFVTPTTRLSIAAAGLPGGFALRANVRGSYRYDEFARGPAPLSIRAYELSAVREFEAVPVQLMLGRFANPYESYSAYWDGILLRVGNESGLGVGTAAGFEPHLQDEGFSKALPKFTAFVDYAVRRRDWRYDSDMSVHLARPGSAFALRYAGWTQRLSVRGLDVAQRLRMVRDGSRWHIGEARFRVSLDLGGSVRVFGSYGRTGYAAQLDTSPRDSLPILSSESSREEANAGIALDGRRISVTAEVGGTRRGAEGPGLSVGGTTHLAWGAHRAGLAARRWWRSGLEVLTLTPTLEVRAGPVAVRTAYRFYRTDLGVRAQSSQVVSADLGFVLMRDLHVTVGAERQWGQNLDGTRVRAGVWRAF